MKQNGFPTKQFNQSISITKKLKQNLKPFLQEYSKKNIQWIYQSILILYRNLTTPEVDPLLKMNSMFAIKCFVDTCDYVCLQFVQAYIFPIIKRGAFCDVQKQLAERGTVFFQAKSKSKEDQELISNYGYNYVKICTELVKVLSVIKPNKLFFNEKTKDPSQFYLANIQLNKKLAQPNYPMQFFKQKPQNLNQTYEKKLKQNDENQNQNQQYYQFVQTKFHEQIKTGFVNVQKEGLDIRELMKIGDMYVLQDAFNMVDKMVKQTKGVNYMRYGIQFVNQIVKCGNQSVKQFLHGNQTIKYLVKSVINIQGADKSLNRGKNFLPDRKGTPQQRQLLYVRFLSSLQLWVNTFTKNSLPDPTSPSKIQKYYKVLKQTHKFQFPAQLTNQIKESAINYQKMKHFNKMLTTQLLQAGLDAQKDDSIILSKPFSTKQINVNSSKQVNNSQSTVKQIKQNQSSKNKQNSSLQSLMNQNQVKATPTGGKKNDSEQFRKRIKILQHSINNLDKSQKQLPSNMKFINEQLKSLSQFLQVAVLTDQEVQTFMTDLLELQPKMQKINPIYDQYKTTKIDYKGFCTLINPPKSTKNLQPKIQSKQQIKQKQSSKQIKKPPSQKQVKRQQSLKLQSKQSLPKIQQPDIPISINKNPPSVSRVQNPSSARRVQNSPSNKHVENPPSLAKIQNKQGFILKNSAKQISQPKIQIKIQSRSRIVDQQEKVQFQRSEINQSRYTESNADLKNSLPPQAQFFKNRPESSQALNQQIHDYQPVTYQTNPGEISNTYHLQIKSPIKNNDMIQSRSELSESKNRFFEQKQSDFIKDQQIIQSPSLNPLNNSYHDLSQIAQQSKKSKTFKQAISSQKLFIKTNKRQNLFWLQSQTTSLIKPVGNGPSRKSSRLQSRINVPQLLQQRSKKHELQMKLLQQDRDRKIRQLQNKLNVVQRQKSTISQQLRAKQYQIRSLKQNSQAQQVFSRVDNYNIMDDQNYLMKKLAKVNTAQNPKKSNQILKNQSRILTTGNLINTKIYTQFFKNVQNEKQKKVQLKNKQLLYKTDQLQIGYMGHLQNDIYKITIFITPQGQFQLNSFEIHNDTNLNIKHNLQNGLLVYQKRQQRLYFNVDVIDTPYKIPTVHIKYSYNGSNRQAQFVLPCAYHKYFMIKDVNQTALTTQFDGLHTIRGQQIPYNKKILKNINLLQDYLPHIKKINRGQPNELGQICFGGIAVNNKFSFIVKISVKPNQFLYIQVVDKNIDENRKAVQFYIATLNHYLIKNIEWN